MTTSKSLVASSAILAIGLASACGGGSSSFSPSATRNSPSVFKSWISPSAFATTSLLYVSDAANNEVDVYSYPALNLVGVLTGFTHPHGICAPAGGGRIVVANTGASNLLEYAYGQLLPSQVIPEKNQMPIDCSFSRYGMAISNTQTSGGGAGTVFVIPSNLSYTIPDMTTLGYLTYDSHANLYVDGTDEYGNFAFAKLVKGQSTFKPIDLHESIGTPGGVRQSGNYILVGDESTNIVYLTSKGTVVGSCSLSNANRVVQFLVKGQSLIGPDAGASDVGVWTFPGCGAPTHVIAGSYLNQPTGSVIIGRQ